MFRTARQRLGWLILILLLAALSRVTYLAADSLWLDEGFTWYVTQYPDPLKVLLSDVHPPVYFYLMVGWVRLVGESELALRYFSVLASFISVALMFQVAREIERQRGSASGGFIPVAAALLLALTDVENHLAQEARSYTLQTVWILLSMWGFLRWTRSGGRGWLVLWLLNLIALVYTFYLAAGIGIVQGVYTLLFLRGRQRRQALGGLVLAALALLPWVALVILGRQTGNLVYVDWIKPNAFVLAELREIYLTRMWPLLLGLGALGLGVWQAQGGQMRWPRRDLATLLVLWAALPLLLTFSLNEALPLYTPRRVSQIMPGILLLVAFGLGNLRQPARGLLVIALIVYGVTTVDFTRFKQPWRAYIGGTSAYIAAEDLALLEMGVADYDGIYYFEQFLPRNTVRGLLAWRTLDPATYESGLAGLMSTHDVVWLLHWSNERSIFYWFDTLPFHLTATYPMPNNPDAVRIYRYAKLPDAPLATWANGMTLRAVDLDASKQLIGLTWAADAPLAADYVTSAYLLDDAGRLVAQQDTQPQQNQRPTRQWSAGEFVYDPKIWQTPAGAPLPSGTYRVGVVVYTWVEGVPQRVLTTAGADHGIIATITLP